VTEKTHKVKVMESLDFFLSYVHGTQAHRQSLIRQAVTCGQQLSERKGTQASRVAFEEFETKMTQCAQGPESACPYGRLELRDVADHIAPGLGNTGTMYAGCRAATDKD